MAAFVALMAALAVPSFASAAPAPPVDAGTTDTSTVVLAAPVVTIIVSVLIPLINGFLTKATTPAGVKAIGTIILNTAAALIINGVVSDGSSTFSTATLYTALIGCIISIASYAGLWKPLNVTSNSGGKLAAVGVK